MNLDKATFYLKALPKGSIHYKLSQSQKLIYKMTESKLFFSPTTKVKQ